MLGKFLQIVIKLHCPTPCRIVIFCNLPKEMRGALVQERQRFDERLSEGLNPF